MNSLLVPDHPDWHTDDGFSPVVAQVLLAAYQHIKMGARQANSFQLAADLVRPYSGHVMSRRQRLRVYALLGMALAATGESRAALPWIDDAAELAMELSDLQATLELLDVRGGLNRALLRLREAAEDYTDGLELWQDLDERTSEMEADIALGFLAQLAGFRFYLAQYTEAERLLDTARRLLSRSPFSHREAATMAWVESHLYRWRDQPERALRPALAAAEVFTEHGSPASAARIQSSVADIYLDLALKVPAGADRDGMVRLADVHLRLGRALAREAQDPVGEALVTLSAVRSSRLMGRNERRMDQIDRVATLALHRNDEALLAQAYTTLADELAARGDDSLALTVYREVLTVLDGSDVPALERWARRALLRAQELDIDLP